MDKWEYLVYKDYPARTSGQIQDKINQHASEGWELFSIVAVASHLLIFTFKRSIGKFN